MAWPITLPDRFLMDGYDEGPPDLVLRTEMDAGPAKMRRKGTAGVRNIVGQVTMTTAQVAILDSYYLDDLASVGRDSWTHPRTGAAIEFRFVRPPRWQPMGGDMWRVQIDLEILP